MAKKAGGAKKKAPKKSAKKGGATAKPVKKPDFVKKKSDLNL